MSKRLIPAVLLAALVACSGGAKAPAPCEADAGAAEFAVYSAAVEDFAAGHGGGLVVISDRTEDASDPVAGGWVKRCEASVRESEQALADSYRERNRHPLELSRGVVFTGDYVLASDEDLKAVPADRMRLEGMAARFPGAFGVVRLSRVGFDPGRTKAVVYVSRVACGLGCGEGACVRLAREGCRWKVEGRQRIWMS